MSNPSDDILSRLQQSAQKGATDASESNAHDGSPFTQPRPIPPLDKWNPEHCGHMDLTIRANGEWWHEGGRMTRQKMVDLFSSVLWTEEVDGQTQYFLKTPVEKIGIQVEDAPLIAVEAEEIEYQGKLYLELKTENGDYVVASKDHPIVMRKYQGEMRPYVLVRGGLWALIHRNTFFHLVGMGELTTTKNTTLLELKSGDASFVLEQKG